MLLRKYALLEQRAFGSSLENDLYSSHNRGFVSGLENKLYGNTSIARNIANPLFHDPTDAQYMDTVYFETQGKTFALSTDDPSFANPVYISCGPDGGDGQEERLSNGSNGQGSAHTSDTSVENYLQMSRSMENLCNIYGEGYVQGEGDDGKWDNIVFYEDADALRKSGNVAYENSGIGRIQNPLYSSSAHAHHYDSASGLNGQGSDAYITYDNFVVPRAGDDLYLSVNPLQAGLERAPNTRVQAYDYLDVDPNSLYGFIGAEPAYNL